ncbi:MAG: cellulose biosynthesis protein BcsG [Pseudoalteromonadaceae bacterium]|nr:cellulose biosynthesis protein BcsG [Pseudoalteromonadaceae bacterium]
MRLSGLGIWNLYFLIKFLLFSQGAISFDLFANLAFFCFLVISFDKVWLTRLKQAISVVIGVVLMYQDSWLPPISRLTKQADNLQDFSISYFFEIAFRLINLDFVFALFIAIVFYFLTVKWLRYTSLSVVGFIYVYWLGSTPLNDSSSPVLMATNEKAQTPVTVTHSAQQRTPDQQLGDFYQQQSQLISQFPKAFNGEPFDVVVLNICSLATADLNAIGVKPSSLFANFDILFSQFNSATSYSGPAAIRLLRASCGQTSQADLFKPARQECLLFNNLAELGFNTNVAMNHDGHFDDFIGLIRQYGGVSVPKLDFSNLKPAQYGFDGEPIYSDADILSNWSKKHQNSQQPQALYYNTISLHDGNQVAGRERMNSLASYPLRQQRLFDDIDTFISQLESSGRNVLLVVVPEHGAALEGDKLQFAGLREIPSPSIVSVPAAVKFIGPKLQHSQLTEVNETMSYFSLSELINNAFELDIFAAKVPVKRVLDNLPTSAKVAENQDTVMMYFKNEPYIQLDGGEWTKYPGK